MKNILLIIPICFILTSCFNEPKKVEENLKKLNVLKAKDTTNSILSKEVKKDTFKSKSEDNEVDFNDNDLESEYEMSINILEFLVKGSINNFENWAVKNDYYFSEIKEYKYFNTIVYQKPFHFISFAIEKDNNPSGNVVYETNNKNEYLFFKSSCYNNGYTDVKSKTFGKEFGDTDRIFNEYSNGKYMLTFILSNKSENLGYTIAIEKK